MSSGQFENDEVSMVDVLAEDNELEEEANAVFGDSDDQNCTYDKGYVRRQALYACLTCTPATPENDSAGVCLACSLSCHDGHELVELYTKRNFRCDCGNEKFSNFECKLQKNKDAVNVQNRYNQNFKGLYCSCHRPYPDPDDEIEDEMIQCISCEDWYHSRHLGSLPPFDGDFSEMICDQCMKKSSFLQAYLPHSVPNQQICTIKKSDTNENVDIEGIKDVTEKTADSMSSTANIVKASPGKKTSPEKAPKRKLSENANGKQADILGETSSKKICQDENDSKESAEKSNDSDSCVYQKLLENLQKKAECTYWKNGWRSKLCDCQSCKDMYKEQGVEFLMDDSDTIIAYEDRGQSRRDQQSTSYDSSLNALNSLGRVQQIEILHGYNDMKTQLTSYLADFAKEGKTVTKEDIQSFFQKLQDKKKKDSGNIPHYCR
ncbi:putative E3 ubiquitin-protein ligase UBR7 [Dendronephthya gigantea]|uniref:putative E3 ubiquitin-protein ligase UBR7 n=1 Tax=Dendronephthya gigantea TaxID=151771 RepID=UPI00106CB919|nr:putative E3 ubiquitin-protein ligase UBR7 [Dendronephthya gigantea]